MNVSRQRFERVLSALCFPCCTPGIIQPSITWSASLSYWLAHLRPISNLFRLSGKRRFNIKLWKTFTDCFNCLPIAAIIDEKIFTMHGGLSPDLQSMEQIRRVMRPTDVPDTGKLRHSNFSHIPLFTSSSSLSQNDRLFLFSTCLSFLFLLGPSGLLCDLLWSDPDKDISGWSENDRGVSFTFGPDVVSRFLQKHDMDLICRAHQVVEDGYEFFAKRQLVTLFSAPNYCGEFDNAGAMMSVDETLLCSFQVSQWISNPCPIPTTISKPALTAEVSDSLLSALLYVWNLGRLLDSQTCGKEAEICLRRNQYDRPARDPSSQAEKERWQQVEES